MINRAVYAVCAVALVAGCRAQEDSPQSQSGNDLMRSAETRTGGDEPDTRAAVAVDAQTAKRLMHERHENMETLGDETKKINRQLKSSSPDVGAIRQSAARILQLAPDLVTWFPPGTGPDVGETHAKPEIWQRPRDFATKANDFVRAAEDFDSAARSGDLGQILASFAALGKSCKACHDPYREPEKD